MEKQSQREDLPSMKREREREREREPVEPKNRREQCQSETPPSIWGAMTVEDQVTREEKRRGDKKGFKIV